MESHPRSELVLALPPLSKEMQLLLACSRPRIDPEQAELVRQLVASGLDWDYIMKSANHHGVVPLFCRNLMNTASQAIPPAVRNDLNKRYVNNANRCHLLTRELLKLLDLFEANGIPAIPFKGPALAEQVYGDMTLRSYVDLDIIVHKEDVLQAKEVLLKEGYKPEFSLNPSQEEHMLRYECEYDFINDQHKTIVEVHWRIIPSSYRISVDANDIWQHLRTLTLHGRKIAVLSPEDLFIFLCIHGAKHNWAKMKQICDLAGLIAIHKDLDWKGIISYAQEFHIERIILMGLLLAQRFSGILPPAEIASEIDKNSSLQTLSSRLIDIIISNSEASSKLVDIAYFWVLSRERIVDGLGCIVLLGLAPTQKDLMMCPLPMRLYPLYYLLNAFKRIFRCVINDDATEIEILRQR